MPIPTPHINAKKEDIAKTVLMPGDPLRAKFIAETFLTDPVLVNNVRGVQGHTGTWKGVPVTVMASGMGIPSIGIYSWELFNFYDVDNIIRIGSAGALQDDLKLRDLVAGQAACTNSNYIRNFGLGETATFAPIADYTLLSTAVACAKARGIDMRVGNILSSDPFYSPAGCGKMTSGSAWAFSPWRWKAPASMPMLLMPESVLCASAPSLITSIVRRTIFLQRSARVPLPR